jgi:hypothetical protein
MGPNATANICRSLMTMLVVAVLVRPGLSGAQVPAKQPEAGPGSEKSDIAIAKFYLPYAAMAARVYESQGRTDDQLDMAATSRWLRDESALASAASGTSVPALLLADRGELHKLYRNYLARVCKDDGTDQFYRAADGAVRVAERRCESAGSSSLPLDLNPGIPEDGEREPQEYVPIDWKACENNGEAKESPVPVHQMTEGWDLVPELRRQLHPRGWSFFVPGLAVDVWRKRRGAVGEVPEVEYALVFRGTADAGGWLSNFRAVTAFTPLVWDQYRQAARATVDLVNQIYRLHMLSDAIFDRPSQTRIRITSVGHSLGGGLANYVFLRIPQITSVVAFDPSPVNGSSTFSPFPVSDEMRKRGYVDRESVLGSRTQPPDRHAYDENANIFVLYERGELLTSLAGCAPGAIWGSEGGPHVRCDSLNLSGGNPVRQHNMPLFACKLYLVSKGLPTREAKQP